MRMKPHQLHTTATAGEASSYSTIPVIGSYCGTAVTRTSSASVGRPHDGHSGFAPDAHSDSRNFAGSTLMRRNLPPR